MSFYRNISRFPVITSGSQCKPVYPKVSGHCWNIPSRGTQWQLRSIVSELRPKDVTTRKLFRGSWMRRVDGSLIGTYPVHLDYGIRMIDGGRLSEIQLQCILDALRNCKRLRMISNFLINVVPDHPITKKPLGARMGGGRGEIVCYGQWVAEGDVIVEFETRNKRNVPIVARRVASAIPLQIDVVTKEEARFSVNAHLVPTFISERLHRLEIHKLAQRPVKGYIQ